MEELINEAKNGDEEAFSDLMMSISDDLYKIARIRINNEEDLNDAIQETMIAVFKSLHKLNDYKKFKFWVIKILVNKCNRIYRKKSKNERSIEELEMDKLINDDGYNEVENNLNFNSLIKNLTYEEKIISTLYYMEEYTIKEIKEIIGMNENTIKTHLYKARNKIRDNIKKGGKEYV